MPAIPLPTNAEAVKLSLHKTELGDDSFGKPYAAAAAGNSIFKKCDLIYVHILSSVSVYRMIAQAAVIFISFSTYSFPWLNQYLA